MYFQLCISCLEIFWFGFWIRYRALGLRLKLGVLSISLFGKPLFHHIFLSLCVCMYKRPPATGPKTFEFMYTSFQRGTLPTILLLGLECLLAVLLTIFWAYQQRKASYEQTKPLNTAVPANGPLSPRLVFPPSSPPPTSPGGQAAAAAAAILDLAAFPW